MTTKTTTKAGSWRARPLIGTEAFGALAGLILMLGVFTLHAYIGQDSGRFRDWQDQGCRQTPAAAGGPGSEALGAGGNQAGCSTCPPDHGAPRWWVDEAYVNLHVSDTPVFYVDSFGQEMGFRFLFKQRYTLPLVDEYPNFYTLGGSVVLRAQIHPYVQYMRSFNAGNFTNAAWGHNWMMNMTFWDSAWEAMDHTLRGATKVFSSGYEALVFRPEGGILHLSNGNAIDGVSKVQLLPLSTNGYPVVTNSPTSANGVYWGSDPGIGFKLVYPDGSQDVFGLAFYTLGVPNPNGTAPDTTADALLTQRIDPQGRVTRIGYEYVGFTNGWNGAQFYTAHRIRYVVDADGRTNRFFYNTNYPNHAWQVVEIDDAYGRKATFSYEFSANGRMSSITDAIGNSNYFAYANYSGWVTGITTPYGTTSFNFYELPDPAATNGFLRRATCVSEPEGAHQFFYYAHTNQYVAATDIPPPVPGQVFDCGTNGGTYSGLNFRNSFHWDRRQYAALPSVVRSALPSNISIGAGIGYLTPADYNKASLKHWLFGADNETITEIISSERDPSPDAGGLTPGLRTWYGYANQPSPEIEGDALIGCVGRVLPDGSSQYSSYHYNLLFPALVSQAESSYSLPDASVGRVTNNFQYALNGIDLLGASNSLGQFVKIAYNSVHQPTFVTNSLNQVARFSYDNTLHKLLGLTNVSGLRAVFGYYGANPNDPNGGFLQNFSLPDIGRSVSYTYSNGLPRSIQDDLGLGLTLTWDSLNRPVSVAFPDTTTVSNVYDRLDLAANKDRLGNWTGYGHDGLEHLTSVTNALQAVTRLSWCDCGALASVTDALTNTTSFFYNNQGLLTNISFADQSSLTYGFDTAQRVSSVADGLNRSLRFGYNIQGQTIAVSNAYGRVARALYDAVGRPLEVTDATGLTVTNAFDVLDRLVLRSWPGGGTEGFLWSTNGLMGYTNQDQQVTRFVRDVAGRLTAVTNANLEVVQLGYNSIGEVIRLIDGLNHTNSWGYNEYGLATNKVDPLGREVFRFAYDPNLRLTNRWMPEFGNTAYAFDPVGNLTNVAYPTFSLAYAYDPANRLTNMADQVGTTKFTWTPSGQLQTEDGPWSNDTITNTYTQGLRTGFSLQQSSNPTIQQSYSYDSARRLQTLASSIAGTFTYGYYIGNNISPAPIVRTIGLPNLAWITNHFDSLDRLDYTALMNRWGHVLDGHSYTHDPLGLRTNIVRDFGLTTNSVSVGYDNIGQLISWSAKESNNAPRQNEQLGWGYDSAHNLQSRTNGSLLQTFNNDAVNELTNIFRIGTLTLSGATPEPATNVTVNGNAADRYGDFTFARTNLALFDGPNSFTNIAQNTYGLSVTNTLTANLPQNVNLQFDSNGNLTNDGTRSFVYNAENQLTNVYVPNGWKTESIYDGLGRRRVAKDYAWSGGWVKTNETRYICDGVLPVQERDSNNVAQVSYTRGLDFSGSVHGAGGIGGLLARTDANGSAYYHADGAGNITALIGSNGDLLARYLYNPFGKLIGQWGSLANANAMQFSSMARHAPSGLSLYAFRAYDPNFQRWLNRDPSGELGSINLYKPFFNSPLEFSDREGRDNIYNVHPTGGTYNNNVPDLVASQDLGGGPVQSDYRDGIDPLFLIGQMTFFADPYQLLTAPAPLMDLATLTSRSSSTDDKIGAAADLTVQAAVIILTRKVCPAKGARKLYRAVSAAEIADLKNGFRPAKNTLLAKEFATTAADAAKFGKDNYGLDKKPFFLLEVTVDNEGLANATSMVLDGKNAIVIPYEQLPKFNSAVNSVEVLPSIPIPK